MHPNTTPGSVSDPTRKISEAMTPSVEEKSAYERVAWQRLLESHEAGMGKSLVCVVQVGDEQVTGEYDEERVGSNPVGDVLLQRSHESSLPVSMTMETFCGGEPTERDTERLMLW